jgi:hypothetical protein
MILWCRFLDWLQSAWNLSHKTLYCRARWGAQWRDKVRPGRTCTRVEFFPDGHEDYIQLTPEYKRTATHHPFYRLRAEPGWEWWCPNCKEYSLITESMMPEILQEWREGIARMLAKAHEKGVQTPAIPATPTPATAGCTNCKYRPGAPE